MDNIVDYLVIIFFVVSAIASIFKKKPKKQEQQKGKSPQQRGNAPKPMAKRPVAKQQVEDKKYRDPFEELSEMLRKPKPNVEKKSEVDLYFEEAISKSKSTKGVTPKIDTSATIESRQAQQKKDFAKDDLKELEKSHEITKKRLSNIQKKLKRRPDIQELIIFNEILGKPKGLRDPVNPLKNRYV